MADIMLLDGGMGQELVHRAGDKPTPLWSTQVMIDHPGLVQEIHMDFFAAGATVATANTYAQLRDRLALAGIEHRLEDLTQAALAEARAARAAHGAGAIAGSIGPLGASYRPDLLPDHETAVALFRERVGSIAPHVDFVIFETVTSVDMVRAVVEAGRDETIWVAMSVDDEDGSLLRSGEPVKDAVPVLKDGCAAALLNCSAPEAMPAALDALQGLGVPTGACANAFTQITKEFLKDAPTVDALIARRDMGPDIYADHALRWLDHGATILGGCCEVGPAHIAEMARRLRAAGHAIVPPCGVSKGLSPAVA